MKRCKLSKLLSLPDVVVLEEVPGDGHGYLVGREQLRFGAFAVQVLGRHYNISFGRRRDSREQRRPPPPPSSSPGTANWLQIERGNFVSLLRGLTRICLIWDE